MGAERTAADLKGYAPCRRPPLSGCGLWGVGCAVLAGLACWAGLGWAGDAGKDELGRLGWPGQAGWACLYTFSFLFGCCFFCCFLKPFYAVFHAMFELWFTLGLHFRTLLKPLGDHLEYQGCPWAALWTHFGLL